MRCSLGPHRAGDGRPAGDKPDRGVDRYAAPALAVFRYVSWAFTSACYLGGGGPAGAWGPKVLVIGLLLLAGLIFLRLLRRYLDEPGQVARLALAEAVVLPAVLLPTGGLTSPFVWYALNPLLVAAVYLPAGYTWAVALSFLAAAGLATASSPIARGQPLVEQGRVVLVLVLVTLITRVQALLARRLQAQAGRIREQSQRIQRTLDYLANVYQVIEGAGASRSEGEVVELVTLYAKRLTGAEKAAFWPADPGDPETLAALPTIIRGLRGQLRVEDLSRSAAGWWGATGPGPAAGLDRYQSRDISWSIAHSVIRSQDRRFGLLVVVSGRPFNTEIDVPRTMGLLGCLAGAMIERNQVEDLHSRLLVAEEQGRIAAEIHDGVSQSLFSLVYGLDGVLRTVAEHRADETLAALRTLRDVAAGVSREIRSSIYKLRQEGSVDTFEGALRSYLARLGELSGAQTELTLAGPQDNLSPALKRALYRMVREAASNAVRHGGGSRLAVALTVNPDQVVLEVKDNGRGFSPPPPSRLPREPAGPAGSSGLGLLNMAQLARAFNGSLRILSAPGAGARVIVRIPDHGRTARGGDAVETASGR